MKFDRLTALALLTLAFLSAANTFAQDEEDEDEPKVAPGLIATYATLEPAQTAEVRVETEVQHNWGSDRPVLNVPPGPFIGRWQGLLFTQATGEYRFYVYAGGGRVQLRLKDQTLLDAEAKEPGWHVTEPLKLGYAHSPLELTFTKNGEPAVLKLNWSGPQFAVEPIPDRHLFHDPKQTPQHNIAEGRSLVRMLRCAACHEIPTDRDRLPAPALTHLKGNLNAEWIIEHLTSSTTTHQPRSASEGASAGETTQLTRRMPHFVVSKTDAEAIAAFLLSTSQSSPDVKLPKIQADEPQPAAATPAILDPREAEEAKRKKAKTKTRTAASVREGELLARSVGCLACHTIGPVGTASLFSGGDLSDIASKRPSEFFLRWLDDPAKLNADHRMPMFKLSQLERDDLTAYLSTLRITDGAGAHTSPEAQARGHGKNVANADSPSPPSPLPQGERGAKPDRKLIAQGRELFVAHNCAACHRTSVELPPVKKGPKLPHVVLRPAGAPQPTSCFDAPDAAKHRPGYQLDAARRSAIDSYLNHAIPASPKESTALDGAFVLQERNCTACHARGLGQGLAAQAAKITALEPELLPVQPTLLPPSLNGVGDKLVEKALDDAVLLRREPLRPWLRVRMPKFPLADAELAALKKHLVDHDRIPDLPPPTEIASAGDDETAQRLAARRLVTADGFGCTSCHKIGSSEPVGITNPAAHGTDLTLLGERIRKPWFDRWVRNPSRIIPRMEMPAIQLPVKGVMHDDVNLQLASVWKVLNEPGFTPPLPNPVRVVRSRNVPGLKERASILTDVFVVDGKTYDSAIVIGLPNRHNVLFDLETNRLVAWWTGDTALQRTKGKSWYWENGGAMVLADDGTSLEASASELLLRVSHGGRVASFFPVMSGQNVAILDEVRHIESGVELQYRIKFDGNSTGGRINATELSIIQSIVAADNGFVRKWRVADEAPNVEVIVRLAPPSQSHLTVADPHSLVAEKLPGSPSIVLKAPALLDKVVRDAAVVAPNTDEFSAAYFAKLPVDTFPIDIPAMPSPPAVKIDVVPGFDGVQLPLGIAEMPTGLAWKADGTLMVTSLKGRVIEAKDTNADGLEDALRPVSDDLAAPYGIAVAEEDGKEVLDVINKYALLRLFDDDGDGYYERNVVAAAGWGHTDDYHDWAVGLPRIPTNQIGGKLGSAKLGYYVGLPCQQDDRSEAKAALRGQGLRLIARAPTDDDPRRFSVEPFCGGLRFPMGLAVNKAGALFASDNQGHYNPFNEINHLVAGRRYGFINKLEAKPGFNPPVESPAIELQHPWTRSVNGMCFLYTPDEVRAERKTAGQPDDMFGPFEGHLLGCEFNYRSLFRMTLHEIDGEYQGAAFPFNEFPAANQPTFEGPTVCEVAPDGDLYVGNLQDSGWGGGRNTGSLVKLRPNDNLPAGMADIVATADGFEIRFTQPVDRKAAAKRESYRVEMFRRISTPQYGGDDVDRQGVKIEKVTVADDGRSVRLSVDKMKAGFVYEFHLENLAAGQKFFPAEGFYTLKRLAKK
jgi:mono/diheme cytochrome c family protein